MPGSLLRVVSGRTPGILEVPLVSRWYPEGSARDAEEGGGVCEQGPDKKNIPDRAR